MEIIKENQLSDFFLQKDINIFISSSSFEDRCFAIANKISSINLHHNIVCRVIDFDNKIIDNSELLIKKVISKESKIIDLKISDPVFTFLELTKSLIPLFSDEPKQIAIDITTFTHEGLLIIFRILMDHKRECDKLYFCYNGAKTYSGNEDERDNKWLTKGVKDVRSIIGYPGYSDPSNKNHLIILFGFERERTIRLIDEFEYDIVSLAFAKEEDSVHSDHQKINEERHNEILSLNSNASIFNITLTDPIKAKNEILDYVSKFENHNVVLAPMNNKVSTIGAGLAALENKSIQLCYLQANQYNTAGYSEPGDDFYISEIN